MTSTTPEPPPMSPDDGGWIGTFIRRPVPDKAEAPFPDPFLFNTRKCFYC